jgi:phthalate 4,5-dioxygenase
MLSPEENELMCRVGPESPMGHAMRRYWLPALLSAELPQPDGDPRRVLLLGQSFVAFRDSNGVVGLLDEHCCHRNASLTLGRVEGCGIRCIYHGWKFAVDGTVMETPNVNDPSFKKRFKAKAYPVREAGGFIWAYLGLAHQEPPFPEWPWFNLPDSNRLNAYAVVNCNYVQVLEGLFDSSHLNVLHSRQIADSHVKDLEFARITERMESDAAPRIDAEATDFGFHYCAQRRLGTPDGERTEARITAFLAPCFVANPNKDLWLAVVPLDDTHALFHHVWFHPQTKFGDEPLRSQQLEHVGLDLETLARHGMTLSTYNTAVAPTRRNHFHQSRDKLRGGHFTGLHSFTQEDVAVAVSAGAIRDRSREMLSIADIAIGQLYRSLLNCARQGRAGADPIGLDADVRRIVGTHGMVESGSDWRSLVPTHRPVRDSGPDPISAAGS